MPNYWLEKGNPWEIERSEVMYKVAIGGESEFNPVSKEFDWKNDDSVLAVAYDIPITGFNTFNTNNLRLWRSRPYYGDEDSQDEGDDADLLDKIENMQNAEYLTSIYYPKIPG